MSSSRRIDRRGRIGRATGPVTERGIRPILDRDFTHHQQGQRWTYREGRIYLEGQDVNELLSRSRTDIGTHLALAGGIDEYRKHVLAHASDEPPLSKFQAVAEAILGKILGNLKRVYDQKTSGLAYSIEDGQFILNGINVRSFLAMYRIRKTEKARQFLKGLRTKLRILLESPNHEKVHSLLQDLYGEISEELGP